MGASTSIQSRDSAPHVPPHSVVVVVGWLMAAWCVGFAVVNVVFEGTDHLAGGEYADYAAAFTVMNWLVVGLKLFGAGIALLSVTRRPPPLPAGFVGVLAWGVFATVAVYVVGGIVEAIGMVSGLLGSASQVDAAGVAYLVFFLTAALGWGVLAISFSRRHALGWTVAALGVLAAPVVLGFLLVAMPALLARLGLMPSA